MKNITVVCHKKILADKRLIGKKSNIKETEKSRFKWGKGSSFNCDTWDVGKL